MEGCPCCVSDSDKEQIHSKQLRELEEDDLSRYAFKALSTWGDTEDFKHYLPRIFELCSTTEFIVDTFVILGKLSYANWRTWPINEQKAIEDFLYEWWKHAITQKSYFDCELLIEIYKLTHELKKLLDVWQISTSNNSFNNLLDFIEADFHNLLNSSKSFKELDSTSKDHFIQWVSQRKTDLENGFFELEKKNPELAERASNGLYVLERS
jgi:hypothetical protein